MDSYKTMKALKNNVIIKMDTRQKERLSLEGNLVLEVVKGWSFNLREERPTLAVVIDGENLPSGTDVLVNYLAIEPTYEVLEENILTEHEKQQGYKIFAIPQDMCFSYFDKGEWLPCKEYLITLRIFKPYNGLVAGIKPMLVKNRMYVVKGFSEGNGNEKVDLSGKVAVTYDWADYQIVWNDRNNREQNLIRTRDREIAGIDTDMLKELKKGKYLIGLTNTTAKTLKEWQKKLKN